MITLRKINEHDLEMVMNWRMKPEVTKYMYTDPKLTIEDQKNWYNKIKDDKTSIYLIIEFESNPVGLLSITSIDRQNQHCFWAYYIADENMRGKGIGKNLECNIYDFVFDSMKLNKLNCEVFTFNEKVIQLHQKFGSKIEGTFREHILKNNKYYDIVRMAVLKSDWEKIKNSIEYEKIIVRE